MVLSETVQFVVIFAVTTFFSAFALAVDNKDYIRITLKVIAGLCWFLLAVTQIYYFGGTQLLAVPFMMLCTGIGLVYCFSIVNDFRTEKHNRIWSFSE